MKSMTDKMEVLREKMEKESTLIKIRESHISELKKDLKSLMERQMSSTESLRKEIQQTREAVHRESVKRMESRLMIVRTEKSISLLEMHVKHESARITLLVKETKKVLQRVEENSEMIKILEEKSEETQETFRNLTS